MAPVAASATRSVPASRVARTARRTVTAARTAAASSAPTPAPALKEPTVAAVRKSVARTAAAPVAPSRPARPVKAHRDGGRRDGWKNRRGATVARVAPATARRSSPPPAADPTNAVAPSGDHKLTPRHPDGPRTLAPAGADGVPVAAAAAASSGTAAAGLVALLLLLAFAAPRLGAPIRLPAGRAPMPPLLALPERPG